MPPNHMLREAEKLLLLVAIYLFEIDSFDLFAVSQKCLYLCCLAAWETDNRYLAETTGWLTCLASQFS